MPPAVALIAAAALSAACVPLTSTAPENIAAPPPPPPPEVRLVSAIEAQGCVLTADNVGAVLLSANLTQAELAEITPRLADAGRVVVEGTGGIRVLTDRCTA